tara:strand:+ start:6573 stop:8084 length:1512 start_codon:yes stop_codon:yes gene_type:complete
MSYFDYKNKLNFSNYMDQINQLDQTVINQENKGLELDQLDLQEQTGFLNEAIAQIGSVKSTVDSIKGGAETVIGGLIAQKGMAKLHSLLKKKLGKDDDKQDDADADEDDDIPDDAVTLGDEDDVANMEDFDDLPPNITQESRFDPGEVDPGVENVTGLETIDEETEDEDPETDDEDDDDDFEDDDEGDFGDDAATIGDNEDVGNMDDFDDLDGVDNVMDNIGDSANEIVGNIGSKVSDLISEGASRIQNFGQQILSNFTRSGPQTSTTDVQPDTIQLPESEPNLFTGGDGGELPSTWTRAGSGEGDIEMSTLGDNETTSATGEGAFEGGDTAVQNSANDLSNNLENGIDNEVSNAADDLNNASTAATDAGTDAADIGEGMTDLSDVTTGLTEAGTAAADAGMAAVDAGVATADAVAASTLTIPVVGEIIMGVVALGGAIFSGIEGANEASNEQKEAQDEQEEAEDKKQEIANQAAQTQQVFKSSNVIPNVSSTVAQNVTSAAF